jgi:hypothetical protein
VTQLVLPFHECAIEPLHTAADPATAEPLNSTIVESATEPLYSAAAPTKTSCLCVQV